MSFDEATNAVRMFFSEVFKRHTEDDAEQVVIVGAIGTIPNPETLTSECPRPWLYTRVLAFFLLTTALLFVANVLTNPGQFSNVLVIGAFAVPFTVLVFMFEFNVFRNISFYTVLKALFVGGALSLIVTAILPSFWFQGITSVADAFVAGVGEEVAKLLVVYWILKRNRAYPYILNGLLVGAAVGAGFAIFETAGYGMMHFLCGDTAWVGKNSIWVLAYRNLLSPGGHVVWAAISGAGLLFAARRETLSARMFRRKPFLLAFFVPVILHVLWDMPFFESLWWVLPYEFSLTLVAWGVVAWFLRRGLEEVDMVHAIVPYRQMTLCVPSVVAGGWHRLWARWLDLGVLWSMVLAVIYRVVTYFGLQAGLSKASQISLLVATLPVLLLLEALMYELFGTTLGKWLFSLRVCDSEGRDVSSKAYFKRLVRLWVSGLGFLVPIVSLVASCIQCCRLSSRGKTSYDESLGLIVVKERMHFLRWIVALPVLLVLTLIIAPILAPIGEVENIDKPSKTIDARIEKAVLATGVKYIMMDDGFPVIKFSIAGDAERMQTCLVFPKTVVVAGTECMLVCSMVACGDSVNDSIVNDALSENVIRSERLWCKIEDALSIRVLVPLGVSPSTFRDMLEKLADDADAAEKRLVGKDVY